MFVTGLEFLPVASDNHTVTSIAEAAVLSISVDNQVCIHSLSYRSKFTYCNLHHFILISITFQRRYLHGWPFLLLSLHYFLLLCSVLIWDFNAYYTRLQ